MMRLAVIEYSSRLYGPCPAKDPRPIPTPPLSHIGRPHYKKSRGYTAYQIPYARDTRDRYSRLVYPQNLFKSTPLTFLQIRLHSNSNLCMSKINWLYSFGTRQDFYLKRKTELSRRCQAFFVKSTKLHTSKFCTVSPWTYICFSQRIPSISKHSRRNYWWPSKSGPPQNPAFFASKIHDICNRKWVLS